MPAQLQFFDMECTTSAPGSILSPFAVTLGPNWQPGDIRVFCQSYMDTYQTLSPNTYQFAPGFTYTSGSDNTFTAQIDKWGVGWRRLVAGDTDKSVAYQYPGSMSAFTAVLFTVRGVDPATNPTISHLTVGATFTSSTAYPVPASTVPSAGTSVIAFWNFPMQLNVAYTATGAAVATPAGWTALVSTPGSGSTYNGFGNSNALIAVAKSFSSSGSTGTVTFAGAPSGTYGGNPTGSLHTGDNLTAFTAERIFFKPAPDVASTAGNATATATATNATFSTSNAVTLPTGSASATAIASTAFNPVDGFWISDQLTLSGAPVTSSVIRWAGSTPAGTSLIVETSINNGASWDAATNNRPIARLRVGDTATTGVIARIRMTRTLATDPPPRVSFLEMQVSTDVGVDELVPVGHGMIDKVTTKAVGGSTGGGSTSSAAGSSAVTSKGGGQTGGGTSIKVHVTDLSRAIKRNVWQMPYTVPSGMNYGDAVTAIVKDRLPSQTDFSISSTARTTPLLVYGMDQGGDPWQDIQELAQAVGFEAFFDPKGVFVFRPVPDPRLGEPVWVFDEDFNPTVVEASRELSDEQTFNDVVVTGQSTSSSNPVSAEAFDNDPSSPTYILGPYGRKTARITFSQITTQDQAQDAANATLFNSLGAADTVTITTVPMPALEPGDVVKINVSNVKANGTYMINSMSTPLSPAESQQLVCFRQSTNT